MAEPESGKVSPNPEAATPAAKSADATKYVGTPAVGTSKAAAAAGVAGTAPSTEIDKHRRRFVWTMVTGFLMAWFLAFDGLGQIKVRDFRTDPSPAVSDAQMEKALYLVLPDGRALPGFEAYRYVVPRVPGYAGASAQGV